MEDDLWLETEEDQVFMEEATLSFIMSSSKRMILEEDAVGDDPPPPGRDCLVEERDVPENKDDLGRDSWSKDDRGSSWTDEESFERLTEDCEGDSTPQGVEGSLSPADILTTKQDDQEGSCMVNDQHRPCTASVMSSPDDPLIGGATESYTGLDETNCFYDERPFVENVISAQLSVEDVVKDDSNYSTEPADDQEVGQDDDDARDDQDGGREEDVRTTTTPGPSVGTTVSVQRYTGKDIPVIDNDTLCAAPPRAPGIESEHGDPSPTTHGSSSTPAPTQTILGIPTTWGTKLTFQLVRQQEQQEVL